MSHDAALLDALSRRPQITFSGTVYRATRLAHDPLIASTRGGRWSPYDGPAILYTSLELDGAIAEIAFHWSQLTPIPRRSVAVHTLTVSTSKTVQLIRSDLTSLGVDDANYLTINYDRTQEIGAAIAFLGCDGLIAPNARWPCENLMIYMDNVPLDRTFTVSDMRETNWIDWAHRHNRLPA